MFSSFFLFVGIGTIFLVVTCVWLCASCQDTYKFDIVLWFYCSVDLARSRETRKYFFLILTAGLKYKADVFAKNEK